MWYSTSSLTSTFTVYLNLSSPIRTFEEFTVLFNDFNMWQCPVHFLSFSASIILSFNLPSFSIQAEFPTMYPLTALIVVISSIILASAQSSTSLHFGATSSAFSSVSIGSSSVTNSTSTAPAASSSVIDSLTPCMTNCATAAAVVANCST